jgi:hypothetical protein
MSVKQQAAGWTAGFQIPAEAKFVSIPQCPVQLVPGALSLGVKQPGRKFDHSPQSIADVKTGGAMPPLPPYIFMSKFAFFPQ